MRNKVVTKVIDVKISFLRRKIYLTKYTLPKESHHVTKTHDPPCSQSVNGQIPSSRVYSLKSNGPDHLSYTPLNHCIITQHNTQTLSPIPFSTRRRERRCSHLSRWFSLPCTVLLRSISDSGFTCIVYFYCPVSFLFFTSNFQIRFCFCFSTFVFMNLFA